MVIFSEFLDKLIIKTLEKLTFKPKIIMILFYLLLFPCVLSIATYVDRTTLNENQIKLIKSINNPQFQADVLNSVEEHGAYIFAVNYTPPKGGGFEGIIKAPLVIPDAIRTVPALLDNRPSLDGCSIFNVN